MPHVPAWGPLPCTFHEAMEVEGSSHCFNSQHGSMCYAAENTEPHRAWDRRYLLGFAMGHPTEMGGLLCTPQPPRGSLCPAVSCVGMHYTCNGTHTIERGEKVGSGYAAPLSISSALTVLPPPASTDGMHNQIKFLKLPASSPQG